MPTSCIERYQRGITRWYVSLDIAPVQSTSGVDSVDGCGLDLTPKLERGMSTAVKMMGNTNCLMQLQKCRPDFQMDFLLKCWDFLTAKRKHSYRCGTHTRLIEAFARESFSNSPGRLPLACRSTITDPRHRQGCVLLRPSEIPVSCGGVHIACHLRNERV